MKHKLGIIAIYLLGAVVWLAAQNFVTTNYLTTESFTPLPYWNGWTTIKPATSTIVELRNGKLYVTHSTHESCFAAVNPGCPGHDKTWRDVYAASNGVVVLERTINQVLVTRTNVTTTQTYEWPE